MVDASTNDNMPVGYPMVGFDSRSKVADWVMRVCTVIGQVLCVAYLAALGSDGFWRLIPMLLVLRVWWELRTAPPAGQTPGQGHSRPGGH